MCLAFAAGSEPGHNVCPQQCANFVTAQHAPGAGVRVLGGNGGTVSVGVVGQHDVRVHAGRRFQRKIQGAGLLRIGEVDRGEVRVGPRLFGHHGDVVESCRLQHGDGSVAAYPVHGGQDDLQVTGRELRGQRQGSHRRLVAGSD
ncbi:hypothetical protein D9M72_424940 [compost metagenome]